MSLQAKVQETVDLLATPGLKVNIAKCSTLDVEEGIGAGIFLRGHPVPLMTEKAVLYLGVPLSFDFRPMTVFARALGRCCNTYFAMRNLFNSKSLPARQKFFLFDLYVTSRWLWCSGLVWPTKQALRSINSQQTTLLLGLLGFRADFFGEFVHNVCGQAQSSQTRAALFWVGVLEFEVVEASVAILGSRGQEYRSHAPALLGVGVRDARSLGWACISRMGFSHRLKEDANRLR